MRRILSWPPLVEIGKRSYGLYLWSWPIFVICGATEGEVQPFVVAMILTVVVTEAVVPIPRDARSAPASSADGGRTATVDHATHR